MEPGTRVRLKADPGRIGIITGRVREKAGKIAVKDINHYGDEVLKVYDT